MTKKILTILLAFAMLTATACTSENSGEPTNNSSASDSSYLDSDYENSSESDADSSSASGSDSSSENSTDDSSAVTSETTSTTSDTTTTTENSTTTTTTKAQATTTTKNTTRATQKPVQTTKATVKVTAKATTKATVKTTPKATQPAVNTAAYVNNIIADINKMFPESQFNKALYDKFERLCKGIPTEQDKKDISEALCNFAIRKFNGKSGTFTCYTDASLYRPVTTRTVTAKQPINIKINRSFTRDNAHLNVGNDTELLYAAYNSIEKNYKGINSFIRDCYCTMDRGMSALIKKNIISHTEIYYSIDCAGWQSGVNHNAYYMWFCHE
ncbi:MAG: hypothetical protein J5956_10830 [Ruminococcus sp.]|nr:hypothetical protein [Ruminococcus sp.]